MDPFKPIPSEILRMILEILPSRSDSAAATEASKAFHNAADPFEPVPSRVLRMILEILASRSDIAAATQASKAFRNAAVRFEHIPSEIVMMILESMASRSDIAAAIQASNAFRDEAISSRNQIRRLQVQKDLSGDLLQAAMAVILFPGPGSDEASISRHLDDWRNNRLLNPFSDPKDPNNKIHIERLDNLCGCLRRVITDYLSKATSVRLPFAYRTLPTWSNPHYSQMTTQRDLRQHHLNSFNINNMETDERCRVYRAFLQYEILSKIYGPLTAARAPAGPQPRFHTFDWNDLFHNSTPASDHKLFGSVREYYIMTHRAVLAQLEMNPLHTFRQQPPRYIPEECEHAPRVGQYDFPPNRRYVVARSRGRDVDGFAVLASGGLDTLVGVLTAQPATMHILYRRLWRECERNFHRFSAVDSIPGLDTNDPDYANYINETQRWFLAGLVRLQRQRAYGVFRDDRFYPRPMASMTQRFRQGTMQSNFLTLRNYRYADDRAWGAEISYSHPHVWASLNQSRILREAWKRCERRSACSWRIMTE